MSASAEKTEQQELEELKYDLLLSAGEATKREVAVHVDDVLVLCPLSAVTESLWKCSEKVILLICEDFFSEAGKPLPEKGTYEVWSESEGGVLSRVESLVPLYKKAKKKQTKLIIVDLLIANHASCIALMLTMIAGNMALLEATNRLLNKVGRFAQSKALQTLILKFAKEKKLIEPEDLWDVPVFPYGGVMEGIEDLLIV